MTTAQSMFQKNDRPTSEVPLQPSISIISEGTVITGDIRVTSDFRLAGIIDGHVVAEGKCIVASTSTVKGNIQAPEADIAGTVNGHLAIGQRLTLRKTAVISGNISTKVLLVEEGARIDGTLKMGREASGRGKNA
jgi:cytoskeletal protein CcmA (bactofilin family)